LSSKHEFTEAPIATLLAENLIDLGDEELDALLAEVSALVTTPGLLTRALGDESVALNAGKLAARKPRGKKAVDVTSLL
jgi:hypothetical protein